MSTLAAAAAPCPRCHQILPLDPHAPDCPVLREGDLAPAPYRVIRLSRDERGRRLEQLLEDCSRRAWEWMKVRGGTFA